MNTAILSQSDSEGKKEVTAPRSIPVYREGQYTGQIDIHDGNTYAIEIKALPAPARTLLLNGQPWSLEGEQVSQ